MKLNPDCMKDILQYIVDNQEMNGFTTRTIALDDILKNIVSDKYTPDEVKYAIFQLDSFEFIKKDKGSSNTGIKNITSKGHIALTKALTSANENRWYF